MSNILVLNQPFPSVGLSSYTFTAPATVPGGYPAGSLYNLIFQATVPRAFATGDGAGSGGNGSMGPAVTSSLVVTVNQNASPIFTSPAISPTQFSLEFKIPLVCAIGDVITVVPTSSNPNDNQLNTLKMVASIGQGN